MWVIPVTSDESELLKTQPHVTERKRPFPKMVSEKLRRVGRSWGDLMKSYPYGKPTRRGLALRLSQAINDAGNFGHLSVPMLGSFMSAGVGLGPELGGWSF